MLMMEEILWEMHGGDTNEQGLPPGYRFHPTDEELVTFYLASKVLNGSFTGVEIAEIDLNRCEPWELPDAGKIGEREWYFFSSRDRKYPTGLRTNRATEAGYWKATGKDKEVYSASSGALLGMKKTLVFYKGRAPRGEKTKWVMHEYRLVADLSSLRTSKEEWVICRIHHKAVVEKTRATPLPLLSHQLHSFPVEEASLSQCMINFPPLLDNSTMSSVLMEDAPPSINNNNSNNNNNNNQNPHLIHQENDPRTSFNISNIISHQPYCISQPHSISSATITNPSPSIVFKTLLSRQDYHFEEPAAAAAAAKERMMNISCNFQEVDPNNNNDDDDNDNNVNWVDKIQQNSVFFEVNGSGGLGLLPAFSAVTDTADNELSTSSVAFNRSGFQMLLDSHIRGHGQLSGCLDL